VKTISLKKVSAVAVASLGFGLLSVVPAQAAVAWSTGTAKYDTATQIAGGEFDAVFTDTGADATTYRITVDGASIITVSDSATNNPSEASGVAGNWNSGVRWVSAADTNETVTVKITKDTAGTATLTAVPYTTGIPGTAVTYTVTFIAATSTALSDANSIVALVDSAAACDADATLTADQAEVAAAATKSMSYRDTAGNANTFLCIITRDGNKSLITSGWTIVASLSAGSFDNGGTLDRVQDAATLTDNGDGSLEGEIYGDGLAAAAGKVTVTVIKGTASFTRVLDLAFYGKIKTATLTNSSYSLTAGSAGADYTDGANKPNTTVAFHLDCLDSLGQTVAGCDYDGDGTLADDAGDSAGIFVVVDSDKIAGSPTFVSTAAASASEPGALAFTFDQTESVIAEQVGILQVDNSSTTRASQKMDVKVYIADASATGTPATISASGTIYIAGAAEKVVVTPAATSIAAGGTTTVNVKVTDAAGYPVADGTTVTLAASNGSVAAPSSKTTANGAFATAANLIVGTDSPSTTVTAIAGSKSASSTVTITGGASNNSLLTQLDALNAKIVALNALIAKIMKKLGVK
jgi:hypothetical protein